MYQTDLRHPLRPLPPPVPAHELTAAQRAEAAEEKAVAYRENVEGDGHPARRGQSSQSLEGYQPLR